MSDTNSPMEAVSASCNIETEWEEVPLKYISEINPSKVPSDVPADWVIEYVDISSVGERGEIRGTKEVEYRDAPSRAQRLVQTGDTIVSTVRTYLKAIAHIEDPPDNLVVSTGFAVLRPKGNIDSQYLSRVIQSEPFIQWIVANSEGVSYPAINSSKLGQLRIPSPPAPVQKAISDYLETEVSRVNELLDHYLKLKQLLEEKRTALIEQGVTKGFSEAENWRENGIPWLEEIPSTWDIAKVGWYYNIQLGKMLDEKQISGDHLAPYLRNKDVQWWDINTKNLPEMDFSREERSKYQLKKNDVLVCEGGEIGRSAVWTEEETECYYQKALHRVRAKDETQNPYFFCYFMEFASNKGIFEARSNQSTISHLTGELLNKQTIPIPPEKTQDRIVSELNQRLTPINEAKNKINRQIKLLKEKRQAQITKAVTGQIDLSKRYYLNKQTTNL